MAQVTWRLSDELMDRVRHAAATQQRSVNDYLTKLAEAATDPDFAEDEAARTRERLARAGLLIAPGTPRVRPDPLVVAAARAAAGRGTQLSELVADARG